MRGELGVTMSAPCPPRIRPNLTYMPTKTSTNDAYDRNAAIDQLTELGVVFDPEASDETLQKLLADHTNPAGVPPVAPVTTAPAVPPAPAQTTPAPSEEDLAEFEVADPEVLRPRELPLVVKPTSGSWKNDAQTEYAGYLNAYAYANPDKWNKKKAVLLARLAEIGNNPSAIAKYRGNIDQNARLEIRDTLRQSNSLGG